MLLFRGEQMRDKKIIVILFLFISVMGFAQGPPPPPPPGLPIDGGIFLLALVGHILE